jgi:putative peptidoglycan lipid II flippase
VLVLVLRPSLAITSLPVAFVIGGVVQLGLLAGFWPRLALPVVWTWRVSPEFRRSLALAVPLVLGTIALSLVVVISRFLAARLGPGSVTVFDYGSRIAQALLELLTGGVLLVSLASWSELAANADIIQLRLRLRQTLMIVLFLMLPIIAMLHALREPVVALILERGHFSAARSTATAAVFGLLLMGLPLEMIGRIYVRLFLARQSTLIMGLGAGLRLLVVLGLSVWLMRPLGVRGLALAEAVGGGFIACYLVWEARRMVGPTLNGLWVPLLRLFALATVAGLVTGSVTRMLPVWHPLVLVTIAGGAGTVVYALGAIVLRLPEWSAMRQHFTVHTGDV